MPQTSITSLKASIRSKSKKTALKSKREKERTIKKPPRFGGMKTYNWEGVNPDGYFLDKLEPIPSALPSFQKLFQVSETALRSEERFSRNAETDLVCRLLLEKKNCSCYRFT